MSNIVVMLALLVLGSSGAGDESDSCLARLEAAGLGVESLTREASAWTESERARHRPLARELTAYERGELEPYFESDLLDLARVREVPALENPGFFERFVAAGEALPVDLRRANGMALGDTILVVESRRTPGLIFHEMVHVAQYVALGAEAYMERYIQSWVDNGFEYRAISMEVQAYELAARYRAGGPAFSVRDDVARRFRPEKSEATQP